MSIPLFSGLFSPHLNLFRVSRYILVREPKMLVVLTVFSMMHLTGVIQYRLVDIGANSYGSASAVVSCLVAGIICLIRSCEQEL